MTLYVAGYTGRSAVAYLNLRRLCDIYLAGHYSIEVIDLSLHPRIARVDQVLAVPMVVRKRPLPRLRIIGDMSDTNRVLAGLDLAPADRRQDMTRPYRKPA